MSHTPSPLKPTHPAIAAYHAALKTLAEHHAEHEGATETAFSRLLADTAKPHGWTLIAKKGMKSKATKKQIFPDGTLDDAYYLPRGFWEAKDLHDNLDAEIRNKIKNGYPLSNTIFEDTKRAVLYQNGQPTDVGVYDLTKPAEVAELLNDFFAHAEPDIEGFHAAVAEFQERVPLLAKGLVEKIAEAHQKNASFQAAFATFFELCQTTLNPNIRREAVDEMLVQHLLTERVFRTIFHESDFVRKNVIAAEVEKVIAALVSTSFSRDEFLKSLDKFYKAIEKAAEEIEDFQEKQHFLNTVYERFFQGYSVDTADTHGIVYTPQPLVDFMCASVEEVLKAEFGLHLGHKDVTILDPCTGTGNFVVNLLRRIPGKDLPRVYKSQLFANEVMLLPYYIAAMNIEHAYFEKTGTYAPFEGLCFADTLDLVHERQPGLFSERNAERIEKEKFAPVNVIIGNPPYNVGQLNENDNNKNRKYEEIDGRIKRTYGKDSKATLTTKLYDPYVKFFRWATDRLKGRDGVVCYVTNNSFVDQLAFDGMRKHLLKDFSRVYHLHLEGNVRENPKLSGSAYNVFGIQVGVGITIAIKSSKHKDSELYFHRVDKNLRRAAKCALLTHAKSMTGIDWATLAPDPNNTWLKVENVEEFNAFLPLATKAARAANADNPKVLFRTYSMGVSSNRDSAVYNFSAASLAESVQHFRMNYNAAVGRYQQESPVDDIDEFLKNDNVKWSESLKKALIGGHLFKYDASQVRSALYRPYTACRLYYTGMIVDRPGDFRAYLPPTEEAVENRILVLSDIGYRAKSVSVLCSRLTPDLHLCASSDGHQCFPFYDYSRGGANVRT